MGLKTKWNRFWTLRNTEGGFTLVELVVVIAILAILAGIAVPTYSGYIKKAREATDMQLIAAVNTAFGAACLEQGIQTSDVETAAISVTEQKVFGISSVTPTTEEQLNSITLSFNSLFAGNQSTPFLTENVMSLRWVPEDNSFVMDHETSVASRIILSNGRTFNVDPDTMADIMDSTYADMGYSEVALVINNLTDSSEDLVGLARTLRLGGRFSAVLLANGLVSDTAEADALDTEGVANGLQMVTAKHLSGATEADIDTLLAMNVGGDLPLIGGTTEGMLQNIADGSGGTATVSAAALQYALVQAYANSDAADGQTVTYGTGNIIKPTWYDPTTWYEETVTVPVSEYLASDAAAEDPIKALNTVRESSGYTAYTTTDQYQNDIDGFVGTMSLLGDNIGTVTNPGAIDITNYFNNGINSQDAADALIQVLGN